METRAFATIVVALEEKRIMLVEKLDPANLVHIEPKERAEIEGNIRAIDYALDVLDQQVETEKYGVVAEDDYFGKAVMTLGLGGVGDNLAQTFALLAVAQELRAIKGALHAHHPDTGNERSVAELVRDIGQMMAG